MSYDPMSSATRSARKGLLVASSIALIRYFTDLKITELSFGGVSLEFANDFFAMVLLLALAYFLVSFTIYFWDDSSNSPGPHYEKIYGAYRESAILKKKTMLRELAALRCGWSKEVAEAYAEFLYFCLEAKFQDRNSFVQKKIENLLGSHERIDSESATSREFLTFKMSEVCEEIDRIKPKLMNKVVSEIRIHGIDLLLPMLLGLVAIDSLITNSDFEVSELLSKLKLLILE
jgi:hypothetical protein